MEPKVIIYIVVGILYFLYSVGKKAQEKKEASAPEGNPTPVSKPVSPPSSNPLEDIMREVKRKQAEAEVKRKQANPIAKPLTSFQQSRPQKDILIHEKKKGVFEEGNYERDLTDEERTERGKLKMENEGIYKIKSVEEMDVEESDAGFQLDARNAIIGSLILERKF